MSNIITAVFGKNRTSVWIEDVWQYDYGQILRIQGLDLPTAVEVHFSLQEIGGDADIRIGVTQDGVTEVQVPDFVLENDGATHDYMFYAFIYLADKTSGNTEYKISVQVNSRPRPKVPVTPEEPELFREAIEAVNAAADRAETAAGEAAGNAAAADKSATEASGAATAAVKTEERIKQLEEDIKKVGQDAEDAVRQQETASKKAVTDHTDAEIGRMQQAATEAENGLKASIKDAGTAKDELGDSTEKAGAAKAALDKSIGDATTGKTDLDKSIGEAGTAKTALDKSIEGATTGKTALDKTVSDARTLNTALETNLTEGRQLKTDLKATGDAAAKAIEDEAATQLDKVQHVSDEIVADREQITQNKADIEGLRNDLNANIPDDDIVGDKPWTSKHIVDMLCPPIEETGNPVQCYPVPGYPLGITASWEPVQEGSGDPSPDNIRPIKGRDRVKVTRCGQNLVSLHINTTSNGITITTEADGRYHLQGSKNTGNFSTAIGSLSLPPGKYTVKKSVLNSSINSDAVGISMRKVTATGTEFWMDTFSNSTNTRTLEDSAEIVVNLWGSSSNLPDGEAVDGYLELMLVAGAEPTTEYIPYQGDTVTLSLPETIYGGSVDAASGNGQKEWELLTLTGTENWGYEERYDRYRLFLNTDLPADRIQLSSTFVASNKVLSGLDEGFLVYDKMYNNHVTLFMRTEGASSVEELKAWLSGQAEAGHPVQVAYRLADPVSFEENGAVAMPGLQGINTVLTDADTVTVTGREDLPHALSSIQASE